VHVRLGDGFDNGRNECLLLRLHLDTASGANIVRREQPLAFLGCLFDKFDRLPDDSRHYESAVARRKSRAASAAGHVQDSRTVIVEIGPRENKPGAKGQLGVHS